MTQVKQYLLCKHDGYVVEIPRRCKRNFAIRFATMAANTHRHHIIDGYKISSLTQEQATHQPPNWFLSVKKVEKGRIPLAGWYLSAVMEEGEYGFRENVLVAL